jgi:hypothetical protein
MFNQSSSSLSFDLHTGYTSVDGESLSMIDVPTFLIHKTKHCRRNKTNDAGTTLRRSNNYSFSSSMSSCSDFEFEAEEQDKEEEQGSNIPEDDEPPLSTKGYFIPGITGRARCLEGAPNSNFLVASLSTPPRRATRSPRRRNNSIASGLTYNGSSSVASIMSGMSQDTHASISKNLAEARELLVCHQATLLSGRSRKKD